MKPVILTYRPEIDGLRAFAVISVIFYHLDALLKGGYLGVDVFFVISGYLISLIILKELKEENSFSYIRFYERRARRILPMLTLISFLTIPASWFLMDGPQLKAIGLTLLTISSFVSNIMFWQNSGYFAAPVDLLPMLHTWSLAIEEQFYIVFPIFLIIFWKYAKKYLLSIIALMLLGSLLLAHWSSQNYRAPAAAFYLLPTRGWELLAGAVLAKVEIETGRPSHKILDAVMPAIGIFLIVPKSCNRLAD
jgi:peptidoglycan/LPS O-acetylase OafA/YrhL